MDKSNLVLASFLKTINRAQIPAKIFRIDSIDGDKLHADIWDYAVEASPDSKLLRRRIKRVFGPLTVEGTEQFKTLKGFAAREEFNFNITWYGAIECKVVNTVEQEVTLETYEIESRKKEIEKLLKEVESGTRTKKINTYDCKINN